MYNYIKLCENENKLRSDLSKENIAYETKLVNDFVGKKNLLIYKYMKNIHSTHDIPTSMYLDDVKATSDLDKASLFNHTFALFLPRVMVIPIFPAPLF